MADEAAAVLETLREAVETAAGALLPGLDLERLLAAETLHVAALKGLAAAEAALKCHERYPLYGNAATEEEPGNCPHDPDSGLHFEADDGSGEWLCEGSPEGAICRAHPDADGPVDWPCWEYAAVLAALTGKGEAEMRAVYERLTGKGGTDG